MYYAAQVKFNDDGPPTVVALLAYHERARAEACAEGMRLVGELDAYCVAADGTLHGDTKTSNIPRVMAAIQEILAEAEARWPAPKIEASPFTGPIPSVTGHYVNTGPEHMPLGLADRRAHDKRLAERGERDES